MHPITLIATKHPETEKLVAFIKKYGTTSKGKVCTAKDGVIYRYDTTVSNYKFTPYYLKQMFCKAAKENGNEYSRQFFCENLSFAFDRANFKGEPDGKISFSELIIL